MAEKYPEGKSPLLGICPDPKCGGRIACSWKCRVAAEYYCTKCGVVYMNYSGKRVYIAKPEVKLVVDTVYREIGEESVDARAFFTLVDRVSLRMLNNRIPIVSREDLKMWGYEIFGSRITKRKR